MLIPLDVCWEIAHHSSAHSVSSRSQLSTAHVQMLRPLLYRDVQVFDAAHILVKSLIFNASLFAYVDERDWANAVVSLNNLRHLTIAPHVPLDSACIPHITFRLQSFSVQGRMTMPWTALMHAQPELEELHFLGDLTGLTPGTEALPSLRHVTGRVDQIAKFAAVHPLNSAVFWRASLQRHLHTRDMQRFNSSPVRMTAIRITANHLVTLFAMVPRFFETLKRLALDEETSWGQVSSKNRQLLFTAASIVNERRIPDLDYIFLICSHIPRPTIVCQMPRRVIDRRLRLEHAAEFSTMMHPSPSLKNFHFCALDGCHTIRNWGEENEVVEVIARPEDHDLLFFAQ
ncbi:hypothetical protein B0H11DRAFT_2234354 [Mycena galericulata]|nr:hypothetical protein B0H11DRAFT_2234354 [Mycena galericulata]